MIMDALSTEYYQRALMQELDREAEKAMRVKAARGEERFTPILIPVVAMPRRSRYPLTGSLLAKALPHN